MGEVVTLVRINAMLSAAGIADRLYKGRGYFYFNGPAADRWAQQGVYVNRLWHLTLGGWMSAYRELASQND